MGSLSHNEPEPKPVVKLVGKNGNAFVILGICREAARRAKWSVDKTKETMDDLTSGSYEQLLGKVQEYFQVE